MIKHVQDDGTEIEVFTADEVKAQQESAVQAATAEFGKTKAEIEKERDDARKALGERSSEFGQFRELHKDVVDKLGAAERTIYENTLAQKKAEDVRIEKEKTAHENAVNNAIKTKAGTDEKLQAKIKEMWPLLNLDESTPELIESKLLTVLGAISVSAPDLVASVSGFSGGTFLPPDHKDDKDKDFADTDKGKAIAKELGLLTGVPKTK